MWPEPFDCPREPVVIGLSGGRDSVALLRMLAMRGVPMQACHVHHGIRGEAADGDAQFCRELCRQFDVPFAEYRVDVPAKAKQSGESLETTARRERRRILVEHALSVGFRAVALAHHADDQAETVLFNLARGAAGLRGMQARRQEGDITWLRPMLAMQRTVITAWLQEIGQNWREDASNADPGAAARNGLRLRVLPALHEAMGRDIVPALLRGARLQGEVHTALEAALEALPLTDPQGRLYLPFLADKPVELCKAVTLHYLRHCGVPDLSEACVNEVCAILPSEAVKSSCNLPGGFRARRAHKRLMIERQTH